MAERKSWVIGVLEILAILTLIGGAVLAFALEGEEEDKTDAESARTGHPGLRVTAYSDDWALGESVDQQRWVIVNQHSGVREAFVSVEQAKAAFEDRTGGKYLHE